MTLPKPNPPPAWLKEWAALLLRIAGILTFLITALKFFGVSPG